MFVQAVGWMRARIETRIYGHTVRAVVDETPVRLRRDFIDGDFQVKFSPCLIQADL